MSEITPLSDAARERIEAWLDTQHLRRLNARGLLEDETEMNVIENALEMARTKARIVSPMERVRIRMRGAILAARGEDAVARKADALAAFEQDLLDDEPSPELRAMIGESALKFATLRLYAEERSKIGREQERPGSGHLATAQSGHAKVAAPNNTADRGQYYPAKNGHQHGASSAVPELPKENASTATKPYRPSDARKQLVAGYLRKFLVNGRPIGECTAGEARAWLVRRGVQSRFAERMVNGLQDDMIIGQYKTEADAERAWKEAEAEANA